MIRADRPHRPRGDGAAVLVPVKGFHRAKTRLRPALSVEGRAALARSMAQGVVRAAGALPTVVMTADDQVARWARGLGCDVLADPEPDLSAAVGACVRALAGRGHSRVIVVHADLPLAADITWLAEARGVVLVPDRRDDGSNALSVPADCGFRFSYGSGSRRRHEAEARRLGQPLAVVRDVSLGWDVDHPEDLRWPGVQQPDPTTRLLQTRSLREEAG